MEFLEWVVSRALADGGQETVLHLLGPPHVTMGDMRIDIPESSKRLLAYVAIRRVCVDRRIAAGMLWPAGDDARAGGSLRTALWRLNAARLALVTADKQALELAPDTVVDFHVVSAWALRMIHDRPLEDDLHVPPRSLDAIDLLPGWYDDWALVERERFRHRMLHGVEALSRHLRVSGQTAEAIDTAMTVVAADPLRESAQRVLIEAHLAEGNLGEARRSYDLYRALLRQELGVDPAPEMTSLVFPNHSNPPPQRTAGRLAQLT